MKEIKEKKAKEKVKGKRFLNLMYGIIAIVFILTFIIIPLAERSQRTYIVTSGSMEPDLKVGDIILVSKAKPEDIEVGDIITFKQPGSPIAITHRCIAIKNQSDVTNFQANGDANNTDEIYFQTKGDANEDNDTSLVPGKNLIGKVATYEILGNKYYVKIPRVGYLNHFIHTAIGFLLLIIIPGFTIIGMELYNVFSEDIFEKDGYTLHRSPEGDYFFEKEIEGKPVSLPKGYKVGVDKETGKPIIQEYRIRRTFKKPKLDWFWQVQ